MCVHGKHRKKNEHCIKKKKKKKKISSVFTGYSGVRLEGIQLSQCAILRLQSSVSQTLEIRTLYRYFAYRLRKIMKTNVLSVSCWHESVVWGKIKGIDQCALCLHVLLVGLYLSGEK